MKERIEPIDSSRLESYFDLNIRHKTGITANAFIGEYCKVLRPYATATEDGSLNEFEKLLTIVLRRMVCAERLLKLLGLEGDPRDRLYPVEKERAKIKASEKRVVELLRGDYPLPEEE